MTAAQFYSVIYTKRQHSVMMVGGPLASTTEALVFIMVEWRIGDGDELGPLFSTTCYNNIPAIIKAVSNNVLSFVWVCFDI